MRGVPAFVHGLYHRARRHPATHRWFIRVFGTAPTSGMKSFFKNLGVITVSFAVARAVSSIGAIVAARVLGSAQFGEAQLALSVAQLFAVPALLGMNAAVVRYAAPASRPAPFVASSFWAVMVAVGVTAAFGAAFYKPLAAAMAVSQPLFLWGVAVGVPYTLFVLVGSIQQGVSRFGLRGLTEIALAVLYLAGLGTGFAFFGRNYQAASLAYLIAYFVTTILAIWPIRTLLGRAHLSLDAIREMAPFAFYNAVCGIGAFLMFNIQRFILNSCFSESDVGVYSLYSTGSINIAAYAGSMIAAVFAPKAAATTNREALWNITGRTWLWGWIPVFAGTAILQVVVVLLSGRHQYPLDATLVLAFSAAACILTVTGSMGQVIANEGVKGARFSLVLSLGLGLANCLLSWIFIPMLGVVGAVIAFGASYALGLIWITLVRKRFFAAPNAPEQTKMEPPAL